MFSAILILLVMPLTDLSRSRGLQFRPLSKIAFYIFVVNFLILMQLGAKHVESPFIELGQISTILYFSHFLIIIPVVTLIENSLIELNNKNNPYFKELGDKFLITILKKFGIYILIFVVCFVISLYFSDSVYAEEPEQEFNKLVREIRYCQNEFPFQLTRINLANHLLDSLNAMRNSGSLSVDEYNSTFDGMKKLLNEHVYTLVEDTELKHRNLSLLNKFRGGRNH